MTEIAMPPPESSPPKVVFLIGSPRSGTTWLQSLLGAHPDVITPQETDLFSNFVAPLQSWWDQQVALSPDVQQARRGKGLPAVLDDDEYSALLADFIRGVLAAVHALDPSASIIVEKSPSHSRHTDVITRYLPDAAFVHIVRDGRDVVASLQSAARSWGSHWASASVKKSAQLWKETVEGARRASTNDRYTEVRYEDLRAGDPEPLRRAFARCGLDLTREQCADLINEYSLERMASGAATSPIARGGAVGRRQGTEPAGFYGKGKVGGWAESWSTNDRLLFDAVAGDLLVELGYEPDPSWAASKPRRVWYRTSTRAAAVVGKVGRRIGRRLTRSSNRLLNRLPD